MSGRRHMRCGRESSRSWTDVSARSARRCATEGARQLAQREARTASVGATFRLCFAAMRVEFTKMHGVGNDFVVFDAPVPDSLLDPARLRALADRRTGIGFDQALLLDAPRRPDSVAHYRIFNA